MTTEEFVDWINQFPIAQPNPIPGAQGPQGPQGVPGLDGLLGLDGPQGVQGTQGLPGLSGPQGRVGATGGRGYQGLRGLQGNTGSQGFQGVAGTAGPQGFQGSSSSQQLPFQFVSSQLELQRALEKGGTIYYTTSFAVDETLLITKDYTKIVAASKNVALLNRHRTSSDLYVNVFNVLAKGVEFDGVIIDGNHPLNTDGPSGAVAIALSAGHNIDVSDLTVRNCKFYNTLGGVWKWPGSTTAPWTENLLIENCHFFGFTHTALHLNWRFKETTLKLNKIAGRYKGQTHSVASNAIWLGNYADGALINQNTIWGLDRHGIEYWNSQDHPANIDGNKLCIISENTIRDIKSFAISAFGAGVTQITNNIIDGCSIGIETYNDKTNKSEFLVSENYINNYSNQGISINNVENGIFINNIFGESNSPHAIQMINGGKDIKIAGNKFKNAGRFNILINARRLNLVSVSQSTNAVFTCAQDVASLDAFVGKRIFIRNAEGMTQLNNRYYTITNINGKTFQVGLDTSSYTPYIGGGIVQERYRDISITNNKFTHEKYPVGFSDSRSFYGYDYQSVILKNNECYYNSSLPNLGGFLALNLANTYIDDSQNPVRTTGISNLTGSNLVVPFID